MTESRLERVPVTRSISSREPTVRVLRRKRWERYLLIFALSFGAVLMIAPFYWTLVTSFKSQAEIMRFPPTFWPQNPTLDHWIGLTNLEFGSFPVFFRNSVFVVSSVTVLKLFTSSLAGFVLAKYEFPGRRLVFLFVLSLILVPFSVTLIPLYDMMVSIGLHNTLSSLILTTIFDPFGIFLMRQFMHGIPSDLLDAARIDGASEFRIFLRIVLPLTKPALAALAIFTFVKQWDSFLWPLVMINDPGLYTLPLGLAQFRGRTGIDVGAVSAGSMVAVLPVLLVFFLAQRRFIEGIALTGVKG